MTKRKTFYDLGDQQRAILEILWRTGGATVRDVWERLSPDRSLAYTSVLSVMQKLEKGGWVHHRADRRRYVYRAARGRSDSTRDALREFLDRVYGGDASRLLGQLRAPGPAVAAGPSLRTLVELRRSAA